MPAGTCGSSQALGRCQSGRTGPPAKRLRALNVLRGFESLPSRRTAAVRRETRRLVQCAQRACSSGDRALGCGPKGRRFESCQAYQLHRLGLLLRPVFVSRLHVDLPGQRRVSTVIARQSLAVRPSLRAARISRKAGADAYSRRVIDQPCCLPTMQGARQGIASAADSNL